MENKLRKIISEVVQGFLDEDYPPSFDMDYFKTLTSFTRRVAYCQQHLERISSGSGRIAYKIDDEKVLKLAKNTKGIAQNGVEINDSKQPYLKDIVADVFDHHPDNLWLEMELARKVSKLEFGKIVEFSFEDFTHALSNYYYTSIQPGPYGMYDISKETVEALWENETFFGIADYIGSYGMPVGDFLRLSSYGIVKREWGDDIVLIDFGLSKDVQSSHYSQ